MDFGFEDLLLGSRRLELHSSKSVCELTTVFRLHCECANSQLGQRDNRCMRIAPIGIQCVRGIECRKVL